jgi:signal transduction histidine kinase
LQADPEKLREVINNLLSNAIEYNKPNGAVDLTVGRENGHLTVEVRDTGIGIPPEAQPRVFERFYRADPSRHTDAVHAGLGLSIVKGYVDLMGGTVALDSSAAGSTFRVQLPV